MFDATACEEGSEVKKDTSTFREDSTKLNVDPLQKETFKTKTIS